MATVCLLFRSKKRNRHSIENVFGNVQPYIEKYFDVENRYIPEAKYLSISKFTKNVVYTLKTKGDVIHVTGENYFCAAFLAKKKTVLTIHDYVVYDKSKGVAKFLLWLLMYYMPIRHSRFVTCVSQKTYDETLKLFPWCEKKLSVVPVSISDGFVRKDKEFNVEKPVILVIGTIAHKNLNRTIEALEGINCILDIIGDITEEQVGLLKDKGVEYRQSANLTNKEVREHYESCDVMSFCSTYEGFGMPTVEAQAVGRVVVTSDLSPMKEVSGGAAHLVDPYSVKSIHEGILEVINNQEYREQLIAKGFENCQKYRNSVVSDMYIGLYNEIIDERKN